MLVSGSCRLCTLLKHESGVSNSLCNKHSLYVGAVEREATLQRDSVTRTTILNPEALCPLARAEDTRDLNRRRKTNCCTPRRIVVRGMWLRRTVISSSIVIRQRLYSTRSPEPNSISEVLVPARKVYIRIIARAFLALSLDVGAGFQVVASAFVAGELPLTQCYSKRGPARF